MMRRRLLWLACALVLLRPLPAAAVYSDIIVISNGDRITGEVQVLSRGQIQMKTDDVGTLTVNWDRVVAIVTSEPLDIGTADGRRFYGRLDSSMNGDIAVVRDDGTVVTTLRFEEVVALARIRAKFLQKIDGSLDVGASYTQSSGVAQETFSLDTIYRQPRFEAKLYAYVSVTTKEDQADSQRSTLQFGYSRFRDNELIISPIGILDSNPDLGFDLRATAALTIGRYLALSNRGYVRFGGGAALGRELSVNGDTTTNVDALATLGASWYSYHYPKTMVDFSLATFPSLKGDGRIRLEVNTKFRRELVRNLTFAVTGYDSYDSHPKTEGARQNDIGYTLSLGWTF